MVDFPPTEQVLLECLQVKYGKHHSSFLPVTTSQCAQAYQTELAIDRTSVKAEERNVFIIIKYRSRIGIQINQFSIKYHRTTTKIITDQSQRIHVMQ